MNSEEFLKFQAEQHEFGYQQINLYSRYLKRDPVKARYFTTKKRLVHRRYKLDQTASGVSRATLISKVFSPFSTHLKPVTSTLPGTGFAKTPFLCSMTFSSAASPPSIARSLPVASLSWTVPIPTLSSLWSLCPTVAILPRVRRTELQRSLAKNFWITAKASLVSRRYTKMVSCFSEVCIISHKSIGYFPYRTSHRNHREGSDHLF